MKKSIDNNTMNNSTLHQTAPLPANENDRLQALQDLEILDTGIDESFEKITRLTKKIFDVPIVSITLIDKDRQWFKSIEGLDALETKRDVSFCAHTILNDDLMIINNALEDKRFAHNPLVTGDPGIRFYAGCPIKTDNGFNIGALCVIDKEPRDLTSAQMDYLKDLAGLVENEIQNHKLSSKNKILSNELDRAERKAAVDELTRLWNRSGFYRLFEHEYNESIRMQRGFAVAMIDIDHFKKINDTYGHLAGDKVLRHVSKKLIEATRKMDIVARWGGEEFIALINDKKENVVTIFNRIKSSVENLGVEYANNVIKCTVTIGVTYFDASHPEALEEVIARADKMLYDGKNTGRNKIVFDD